MPPFAFSILTPVTLSVLIPFVGVTYKETHRVLIPVEPVAQAAVLGAYAANHEEIYKSIDAIWAVKDSTRGKVSYEIIAGPEGEPDSEGKSTYDVVLTISDLNATYIAETSVSSTDFQAEADDYGTTRFWIERPLFTKP
jgi:hypothetical protein